MAKFFAPYVSSRASVGLLVVRLVAGSALILHGLPKWQKGPAQWMAADSNIPGWLQFLAAFSEVGGGIALVIGLLAPLASLGILCTMSYATFTHVRRGDAFVGSGGSFELPALFFAIAALMLFAGAGKFSLDYLIFGRRQPAEAPGVPRRAAEEAAGEQRRAG